MKVVLIMAGGIGSRFWPESTSEKPKQFLKLINDKTMIRLTFDRMKKMIPENNIFIVTNDIYADAIKKEIPEIKDTNIIKEPASKNTAPCILLSSLYLKNLYGSVDIICVPSDHYINDEDEFLKKLEEASAFLNKNNEAIMTIGINPTRAETAYGYINYDKNTNPHKVIKFVEKPNYEKALEYLNSKKYLWNAGIFVFNNLKMIEEIKNKIPGTYNVLKSLPNINNDYERFLNENYHKCEKISIDYAVLEKSNNVYTIPADIGWDDIGTWASLERYLKKDEFANCKKGNAIFINSKNNVVYAKDKKVILTGVNDLFFIDSDEIMIIGKKDEINDVIKLKEID